MTGKYKGAMALGRAARRAFSFLNLLLDTAMAAMMDADFKRCQV